MTDDGTPRLALLVSGQFRVHDGVAETLRLLAPVDHTVFVSTWRTRGIKIFGWIATGQMINLLGAEIGHAFPPEWYGNYPALFERLPAWRARIEAEAAALQPVSAETLAPYAPAGIDIEDEALYVPVDCQTEYEDNTEKMLYKMARGLRLIAQHERATGRAFTHILRLRPDASLPEFDAARLLDTTLHFDWAAYEGAAPGPAVRVGDNLICAPRELFARLVSATLMQSRRRRIVEGDGTDPHHVLAASARALERPVHANHVHWHTDEWPKEGFLDVLEDHVASVPHDAVAAGFLAVVEANRRLAAGDADAARHALLAVPAERETSLPVLKATALTSEALGDTASARRLAVQFERQWHEAAAAVRDNMTDLRKALRHLLPA